MSDWYELIGQTAVLMEGDIISKAMRFEVMDRRVAETTVFGMCRVSTVFLSLDHSWGGGAPVLFETMAFWRDEHGYEQERCSTWLEAQEQHARVCAEVTRPAVVVAYLRRQVRKWWEQAKRDLGVRWRELRGIEPSDFDELCESVQGMRSDWEEW